MNGSLGGRIGTAIQRPPLLLAIIFCAALYLRLSSIAFGLPALNDPDELMFELGALRMLSGPTLNPGWFGHPATTTMYVLALVDVAVFVTGYLAGWFSSVGHFGDVIYGDPTWVILPGRIAVALFALGTIYLSYRLASRLFGRKAGLIAATLLAFNPVHITYSQIIRSDMMACFFMLLCMLSALEIANNNRWRDYVMASLWLGLAIATKWPFALSGLAVGGAVVLLIRDARLDVRQALLRLTGFGLMTCAFLFLASPYLLIDHPTVLRHLSGEGQIRHLGATGGTILENALWYISGPFHAGLGITGLALLLLGGTLLRRSRQSLAILAPVIVSFFLLLCFQRLVWERWALPLMPLCTIVIAAALAWFGSWIERTWSRRHALVMTFLAVAVMLFPLVLRANVDTRERLNDTRQMASQWARRHIPAGRSILIEHFAFDIAAEPWHFLFPIGDAGCVDALGLLRGKTSYAPIEGARGTRSNVDFGTVAPFRRQACKPDYAILTQYDRYRREKQIFPSEYAAYRGLIAQGSIVAAYRPVDGVSGGPVVTIVAFHGSHGGHTAMARRGRR